VFVCGVYPQDGGPIALIRNGDTIEIDARKQTRAIRVMVSEEELQKRRDAWRAPPLKATRGALYKVSTTCPLPPHWTLY